MTKIQEQFKDPTSLTKWVKILLVISIIMHIIGVASGFMEYQLLKEIERGVYRYISDEAFDVIVDKNDMREMLIGLTQFLLFIIQGIMILMWIFRANKNVRALGATNMRFSAGWSVGWYFIPLLTLWKPYQAMKEIFVKSAELDSGTELRYRSLLPIWWTLWIISEVIGRIILKNTFRDDLDNQGLLNLSLLHQLGDGLDIFLNVVFLFMVIRLYEQHINCWKRQENPTTITIDRMIRKGS